MYTIRMMGPEVSWESPRSASLSSQAHLKSYNSSSGKRSRNVNVLLLWLPTHGVDNMNYEEVKTSWEGLGVLWFWTTPVRYKGKVCSYRHFKQRGSTLLSTLFAHCRQRSRRRTGVRSMMVTILAAVTVKLLIKMGSEAAISVIDPGDL